MAKTRIGHSPRPRSSKRSGRLHRRERGPDARRRGLPHRQMGLHRAFVCGATNLGEALRRISEGGHDPFQGEPGPAMSRSGAPLRSILGDIGKIPRPTRPSCSGGPSPCKLQSPRARDRRDGKLPVPLFCAGGIATPADARLSCTRSRVRLRRFGHLQSSDPPASPVPSSRPPPLPRCHHRGQGQSGPRRGHARRGVWSGRDQAFGAGLVVPVGSWHGKGPAKWWQDRCACIARRCQGAQQRSV